MTWPLAPFSTSFTHYLCPGSLYFSHVGLLRGPPMCQEHSHLQASVHTVALPSEEDAPPWIHSGPCSSCHFLCEATPKHLIHNGTLVTLCLLFLQQYLSSPGITWWKRYLIKRVGSSASGQWKKNIPRRGEEACDAKEWKDSMPTELQKQLVKSLWEWKSSQRTLYARKRSWIWHW